MTTPLLQQRALTAVFLPGRTALGHHWELRDADDALVGTTERTYSGGRIGRAMWRTVTATGMDSDNDIAPTCST